MQRSSRALFAAGMTLAIAFAVSACGGDGGTDPDPDPAPAQIRVTVSADGSNHAGVTTRLFAAGGSSAIATLTTGSSGTATFTNLDPGDYDVEVTAPSGFELASGESGRKPVTATSGQTANVSFALASTGGGGQIVEVRLTANLTFVPAQVTISPGQTIRWVNEAAAPDHTVTPDGHSEWTSQPMTDAGQTFEHTFNSAGSFPYFCEPHLSQGMTGTITVQ
ncbi:MAG: plastocyanin/azurin family copper-binding protein [Vicinamibacterales bacterium]